MRLINVDNFIKNLRCYLDRNFIGEISSQSTITIGELASLIKDEPTSYDIDKVVNELEKESYRIDDSATLSSRDVINIEDAIEIVKQGGVADDVCEWKYSGNVFISCNYKRFTDLHSFDYCPYCGKKIKVVK